jgi:hypothetical protein
MAELVEGQVPPPELGFQVVGGGGARRLMKPERRRRKEEEVGCRRGAKVVAAVRGRGRVQGDPFLHAKGFPPFLDSYDEAISPL